MKREKAKQLAQHYFKLLADQAGMRWDHDNASEIDELVDVLIDAAKEESIRTMQQTAKGMKNER